MNRDDRINALDKRIAELERLVNDLGEQLRAKDVAYIEPVNSPRFEARHLGTHDAYEQEEWGIWDNTIRSFRPDGPYADEALAVIDANILEGDRNPQKARPPLPYPYGRGIEPGIEST